jgi:hypothetical protein
MNKLVLLLAGVLALLFVPALFFRGRMVRSVLVAMMLSFTAAACRDRPWRGGRTGTCEH